MFTERATRALIFRDNIKFNIKTIRGMIKPGTMICAAVKADGYGHGAVEVSRTALAAGADCLGIAVAGEGRELREAGISVPILVFSHLSSGEIDLVCKWSLEPFAGSIAYIKALEKAAGKWKKTLDLHLKIDTGMGRIGCSPGEAAELARYIENSPFLHLKGTCTHFPVSDSIKTEDIDFTVGQISLFNETLDDIRKNGLNPGIIHAANSGAITAWPEAHYDMVRPGIILYGYYPDASMKKPAEFKPVMQLEAALTFIKKAEKGTTISYGRTWEAKKDTIIGTIAVGYADGYNRLLSNRGEVFIRGKRFPLAGRICMDQTMINLGNDNEISLNDAVILFGPGGAPTAEEIGLITGTIPYEVTCSVSRRVPRIFC